MCVKMSLHTAITSYLAVPTQGLYAKIQRLLESATISEVADEYKRLPPGELKDLLLENILEQVTVVVVVGWYSITKPTAAMYIGFDDEYDILDDNGFRVYDGDVYQYTTLTTVQDDIIRAALDGKDLYAVVRRAGDGLEISSVVEGPRGTEEPRAGRHRRDRRDTVGPTGDASWVKIKVYFTQELHDIFGDRDQDLVPEHDSDAYALSDTRVPDDYGKLWHKIHTTALQVSDLDRFAAWIWAVAKDLPCSECKYHMLEYITQHPPTTAAGQERPAFYWTWQFHNAVNRRLGKTEVDYATALQSYLP